MQLVHPEDAQKVKNKQSAILNNKNEFYWEDEYRFLKANNHYAYVHGKGYIIRDENGKATRLIGATQDVTKLKEQVFEITRIQQNLDSLINNTVDQIWSVNTDFKIITANKAYKNLIEHLTGAPVTEGDKAIYQVIGEALANKWKGLYTRALSGDTFSIEESVTNPVTAETVHGIISFSPIIDGEGQVTGVACFAKDITELKNASNKVGEMNKALQQKAEELALSNAELEQFAYVASHDLQEPLRMVTSFLTQIEKKYSGIIDDKGRTYIHFAVDGAKRMRQIILDLLEFSRVGKGNETKENVDLNILVKEVEMLLRKQVEEKNAYILLGRLPIINTYIAPLTQVFQNLISNALKYSKVGIAPQIRITAASLATHWQFAITDNGIGLSEEYFDKIFIIFQRLHNKDEYSGTGMGLAITKKIVEGLGGKIWVESEEGKGSTFYFTLLKQ